MPCYAQIISNWMQTSGKLFNVSKMTSVQVVWQNTTYRFICEGKVEYVSTGQREVSVSDVYRGKPRRSTKRGQVEPLWFDVLLPIFSRWFMARQQKEKHDIIYCWNFTLVCEEVIYSAFLWEINMAIWRMAFKHSN